jgi:SAM-dependent methyltransferase
MQLPLSQTLALEAVRGARSVNHRKRRPLLRSAFNFVNAIGDPRSLWRGITGYGWFLRDWRAYTALSGAGAVRFRDCMPQLHDRVATTPFDAHYFFLNAWAMRRVVALAPKSHVDIGSAVQFASMLSAVITTAFVDYRPLPARCEGMASIAGDITALPFADRSLASISCLHVAEHVGLGRYGDPLDPEGTRKAAAELARVLAPGGSLFFGLPVGVERTCFNAHRIHAPETVCGFFKALELLEFSGVRDDGSFTERARLEDFGSDVYACGMYWFRKPVDKL